MQRGSRVANLNPNSHMKNTRPSSSLTRRGALGLILAGITLPTTRALAAKDVFIRSKPHISGPIVLRTFSGANLTAIFDSDLTVGAKGWVRGFVRFDFGGDRRADYVAERGGLDFDAAGVAVSATVLLLERHSDGRLAHDYALLTVAPVPGEDCLIYTTVGSCVHSEPVRSEVSGTWIATRR